MTKVVDIERLKNKYFRRVGTQFDNAIFAAENEFLIDAYTKEDIVSMFNKIRDEIEEYKSERLIWAIGAENLEKGKQIALEHVLEILDKYKAESEEMGSMLDNMKKIGNWIYNPETDLANCSNCGASCPSDKYGRIEVDYCPNCNSFMKTIIEADKVESEEE